LKAASGQLELFPSPSSAPALNSGRDRLPPAPEEVVADLR